MKTAENATMVGNKTRGNQSRTKTSRATESAIQEALEEVRELDAMDEAEQRPKKRSRKGTKNQWVDKHIAAKYPEREFRYQDFADTRTLLTPELFWYQDFADTRNFADTRALLAPELFWYQDFAAELLTPEQC